MKDIIKIKGEIIKIYKKSSMYFREDEINNIEIADFGLGDFYNMGLSLIVYVNTENVCAKEMAILPYQICPQHRHPPINNLPGKEETFRCRWGEVFLYIGGEIKKEINANVPEKYKDKFSVFHEVILKQGDQFTLHPNAWHWFQGGPQGAVLSEFSTQSFDKSDIFLDKNIIRKDDQ